MRQRIDTGQVSWPSCRSTSSGPGHLEAASALFVEPGYAATPLAAIAAEAGVGSPGSNAEMIYPSMHACEGVADRGVWTVDPRIKVARGRDVTERPLPPVKCNG